MLINFTTLLTRRGRPGRRLLDLPTSSHLRRDLGLHEIPPFGHASGNWRNHEMEWI